MLLPFQLAVSVVTIAAQENINDSENIEYLEIENICL